jgi:hypothetical protein
MPVFSRGLTESLVRPVDARRAGPYGGFPFSHDVLIVVMFDNQPDRCVVLTSFTCRQGR